MKRYDFTESNPSRNYSDLNLAFTQHPISKDVSKKRNEESIKQSIKTLVLLNKFEKPFHPEIGGGIYDVLFDNIEQAGVVQLLKRRIANTLALHEPRVELKDVNVQSEDDNNGIVITIYFQIINTLEPSSVDLFLKVVR